MPDLAEISQSSGVKVRKLRYVLDHQLLPGAQDVSQGRGTARSFTPFEIVRARGRRADARGGPEAPPWSVTA